MFFLLLLALGLSACRGDEVEEAAVLPTSTPVPEATQPPPTPQPPTPTATAALPTATATETATLEPAVTAEPTTAAAGVVIRGHVTVHGDMNVRAGPGTEYPIVGGATLGQEFDVTGKNADGNWWQIDLEGQPGWIFAPYVTAVDTENVPVVAAGEMEMMEKRAFVTVNGDMNVRNGPGTNYAVIGPATYGQEYDITGQSEDGEWWRIEYIGQTGWIFAPFVEAAGAENVATVGSVEVPAQGGAVVTVNGEMNVRQGPGTTYEIVGAATLGQEFPVTGKNADGDWWQIDFNGQAGWLFAPFVTAANTENVPVAGGGEMAAPEGAQATVDSDLNVRAGPGTEYDRIGGANAGEQFQITGKDETGEWFRLEFDGQNGWVFALFVTATGVADVPVVAAEPAAPAPPAPPGEKNPPRNPPGAHAGQNPLVDRAKRGQ
ncbi:MAG: SH3 domain-containing protein, partial [Caldilineaceae bacterium]|nr:SH3 domain-containing protein [Caldilineaceae bacterium]